MESRLFRGENKSDSEGRKFYKSRKIDLLLRTLKASHRINQKVGRKKDNYKGRALALFDNGFVNIIELT